MRANTNDTQTSEHSLCCHQSCDNFFNCLRTQALNNALARKIYYNCTSNAKENYRECSYENNYEWNNWVANVTSFSQTQQLQLQKFNENGCILLHSSQRLTWRVHTNAFLTSWNSIIADICNISSQFFTKLKFNLFCLNGKLNQINISIIKLKNLK